MDERFKKVATDPRFTRPRKKQTKVKIDNRFKDILSDEFASKPKVDQYGRKVTKSNDLGKYYDLFDIENQDKENIDKHDKQCIVNEVDVEEESEVIDMGKVARGEIELSSDDELEEIITVEGKGNISLIEETEEILDKNEVETTEPTNRLAVVNLDWDNISAKDIYKALEGFKGDGDIKVYIYLSEFGKEMLEREKIEGPPKEIFAPFVEGKEPDDSEVEESEDDELIKEDLGDENIDREALRKYQLSRLRYYYAIVTCDTTSTAIKIYKECDGNEFESSGNIFDLRYVPDEMDFENPVDECNQVSSYKARNFVTHVLQSEPKLTWDETDTTRVDMLRKAAFSQEDIDNMDFDAYLASSDSEGELDVEKYKKLLLENKDDEEGEELNVTFSTGLSEVASDLLAKKKEKEEEQNMTVFEQQMKKKKEKKKAKNKEVSDVESCQEKDGEDPFLTPIIHEDPKPSKKTKSIGKQDKEDKVADEKELSLLLMDDENIELESKHFDYDEIVKNEKKKHKKSKKHLHLQKDKFEVDVNDSRFESIFTSSEFALDPTSSKFKKTKNMDKLLKERQKRKTNELDEEPIKKKSKPKADSGEWKSLVNKIKNK